MELLTGTDIRDFKLRGYYFNQRSVLSRSELRVLGRDKVVPSRPGYSPPVVDLELTDGSKRSIVVTEVDVPLLCHEDWQQGKTYLSLILNARGGDPEAARDLG